MPKKFGQPEVYLTPTEKRFFDLMSDGKRHWIAEFIDLLPDPLSGEKAIMDHITHLRQKLATIGEDVIRERVQRKACYSRIRRLSAGE